VKRVGTARSTAPAGRREKYDPTTGLDQKAGDGKECWCGEKANQYIMGVRGPAKEGLVNKKNTAIDSVQ